VFVRSIQFQRIRHVLGVRMWCILHVALAALLPRLRGTLENMKRIREAFVARLEWRLAPHKLCNDGLYRFEE